MNNPQERPKYWGRARSLHKPAPSRRGLKPALGLASCAVSSANNLSEGLDFIENCVPGRHCPLGEGGLSLLINNRIKPLYDFIKLASNDLSRRLPFAG